MDSKRQRKHILIGVMALVVLIGLVASALVFSIGNFESRNRPKIKKARVEINGFFVGLNLFYMDNGRHPTSKEGLSALLVAKGKYLKFTTIPLDPWGNPYLYRSPGEHADFELISFGPDGVRGGEDDIVPQADTETADAQ